MRAAALTLLLFGLTACGSRAGPAADLLVGEWRWVETSGGLTGETRTNPEHRWRLRLDRNGTVQEEYAGRPLASGTYEIEATNGAGSGGDALLLELDGEDLVMAQDGPFELAFVADTMLLSSVVADGFAYRFVRVGER